MEKYIMHSDINHCFAQIHEMMYPQLKNIPMLIGGSEKKRNGIVLARNQLARQYGIKTAQTLREAKKLCPDILIIPPDYHAYQYYSNQVKEIYKRYSDKVESFGIDEAWVDLTNSQKLFGNPIKLAKRIQKEIYDELGLTVSIGLSFNKIFAKIGSDLIKPNGFVYISKKNYQDIVYNLEVRKLLNVGSATERKLNEININTIGDLANANIKTLTDLLGVNGLKLYNSANGIEISKVSHQYYQRQVKSVGNGITTVKDIETYDQLKIVFQVLAESIASRLKDINQSTRVISISIRNFKLKSFSKQITLDTPTNISKVILNNALLLASDPRVFLSPIRSVQIKASSLVLDNHSIQLNLFEDYKKLEREKIIDKTIDKIRNKYYFEVIKRANVLEDIALTSFNPKESHTIYPLGYNYEAV